MCGVCGLFRDSRALPQVYILVGMGVLGTLGGALGTYFLKWNAKVERRKRRKTPGPSSARHRGRRRGGRRRTRRRMTSCVLMHVTPCRWPVCVRHLSLTFFSRTFTFVKSKRTLAGGQAVGLPKTYLPRPAAPRHARSPQARNSSSVSSLRSLTRRARTT